MTRARKCPTRSDGSHVVRIRCATTGRIVADLVQRPIPGVLAPGPTPTRQRRVRA